MSTLNRLYEKFHGRFPNIFRRFNFYTPKSLIVLGRIHSVTYETDKLHGGGEGNPVLFEHEFESYGLLCMDERAGGQYYIIAPKSHVTERGIEN